MMDEKLTNTFICVCQIGSIRGAAVALEQEASTISRRLTTLETKLSIPLLERRKKGVVPTEAGALLLDHLRKNATEFEALVAEFDALRGIRRGQISLAVGDGFISDLVKNSLPSFRQSYPDVTFRLHSGPTETVVHDIQNDVAHLGFVFNAKPDQTCKVIARMQHPLMALVSPTSHWAQTAHPISIQQLATLPLALLMPGSGIGAMVREVEGAYGVRLNAVLEANSLASVRNFVREGLGVTILPAFVVAREIADGTITTIPLDVPEFLHGEAALIARAGRRLPPAVDKIAHHCSRSMLAFQQAK